jgi:hypothetical protein
MPPRLVRLFAAGGALLLALHLVLNWPLSVARAIEVHGSAVEARLAQLGEAAVIVDAHPLIEKDDVGSTKKLRFCADDMPKCEPNAAFVYAEDLHEPGEVAEVYARIPGELVARCAAMLRHRSYPYKERGSSRGAALSGDEVGATLKQCADLEYVLVLRTVVQRKAADRTGTEPAFDGGYVAIEAHVFGLQPFEALGAFTFDAENSASVDGWASKLQDAAERDLSLQLVESLQSKSEDLLSAHWASK